MDTQETILKITDYDEILDLHNKRQLVVTNHEEIFSLDETKERKLAHLKDAKVKKSNYEEDDSFFDYINEVSSPNWFDFKKFFNYKQKRISSKRAKENLHSKQDFPIVNPNRENARPHRHKLPYCQSEIFPSISSSHSSFYRRWHNFSLPRFTIYRMSRESISSLRFDSISSSLTTNHQRSVAEIADFELIWRLNEMLNQRGGYERYYLKSHLRQYKEDHDNLELFRLYTAGIKKAPQVTYDPEAAVKPSLKRIASLEVLESDKAIIESGPEESIKSNLPEIQKKKREHVKFEQKKSILPEFRYTGEEQFRVIVYDDEVPYLDFDLDRDERRKHARKIDSDESIVKLRPDYRNISMPEVMSDSSLIGMGDYKFKPEDINKPVMLKFKNMPELLGWFKKINEKELNLLDKSEITSDIVSSVVVSEPKQDIRDIVVNTPLVGLKKFQPLSDETGIEFKKLNVTTHDTILSIVPKSIQKDDIISDSEPKEECLSMENVVDKLKSGFSLKRKPGSKNVTYKTKASQKDSLQRMKSSIVNEVVKKVASYFSKDLKPKLEASIKHGQCKCCQNTSNNPQRKCACSKKKTPKVSKGVTVDLNDLSNDLSDINCPPAGCRPNFGIFACPTVTYFRNTGVNANTELDHGSSGDSLSVRSFDCQKMIKVYETLAQTAEEQMNILREYQNLIKCDSSPKKDVKFCKTVLEKDISTSNSEEERKVLDLLARKDESIPADFSSHMVETSRDIEQALSKMEPILSDAKNVQDYTILDSCSSNDSVQSSFSKRNDILKFGNHEMFKESKLGETIISRMTNDKIKIIEDTSSVTDISDFECYISYVCTHSEKFVQIPEELKSKKLKRQTSCTNLMRLKKDLTCNSKHLLSHGKCNEIKFDLNNNVENYSKDLVILFKRNHKRKKISKAEVKHF